MDNKPVIRSIKDEVALTALDLGIIDSEDYAKLSRHAKQTNESLYNLLVKNDTVKFSDYHVDLKDVKSDIMTTAIFYLNTNNGATEFKSGEGVDSIKNRLVVFPKNTYHRAVNQTDTDKRIVLNFNYITDNT